MFGMVGERMHQVKVGLLYDEISPWNEALDAMFLRAMVFKETSHHLTMAAL